MKAEKLKDRINEWMNEWMYVWMNGNKCIKNGTNGWTEKVNACKGK